MPAVTNTRPASIEFVFLSRGLAEEVGLSHGLVILGFRTLLLKHMSSIRPAIDPGDDSVGRSQRSTGKLILSILVKNQLLQQRQVYMEKTDLLRELLATYGKHGWQLRRILLKPTTLKEIEDSSPAQLKGVAVTDFSADALWFSRPSHNNREAWELRLLEGTPYALFETFEPDETEEQRDDVRQEMEARLREYVAGAK